MKQFGRVAAATPPNCLVKYFKQKLWILCFANRASWYNWVNDQLDT